jgi:uncharacterized lipoprotein NlpE involved in copper resistance
MKKILVLVASAGLLLIACNNNSAEKAAKEKTDSLAAIAHRDSLLNASKAMMKQDSIDAAKKDTTQKADSANAKK